MRSRSHEFLWAFIFGRKTPRLNVKAPAPVPAREDGGAGGAPPRR
ncbi:hypothetical protein [Trebonia sp.]